MELTVYNYLDLSTTHITQEDAVRLAELALEEVHGGTAPCSIAAYAHGWFIGVPGELDDADTAEEFFHKMKVSDALQEILTECSRLEIGVLRLDSDGNDYDHLPKFDW